jgi:hypothetical protein
MARYSIPSPSELWQQHESIYVTIFRMALNQLAKRPGNISNEDMISERLCPILNSICYFESKYHQRDIPLPCWEKPNQPSTSNELKGGKIRKRPDFTCTLHDRYASCADEYAISLHIECKRLGSPTSASWKLNEKYVTNGIKRFDCSSHEYGKRASSGMMIGYIISMTPSEIQDEVNAYQNFHFPNNPKIVFSFNKKDVEQCFQQIKRTNVKPNKFKLIHLWVDLRS